MREFERLMRTTDITKRIQFNPKRMFEIEDFFSYLVRSRATLVSSVRGSSPKDHVPIKRARRKLHSEGKLVFYPKYHNFQEDQFNGIVICNTMRYAISKSGVVAVYYNPFSEGSKVGLGMALWLEKPIRYMGPRFSPELAEMDPLYRLISGKEPGYEVSVKGPKRTKLHDVCVMLDVDPSALVNSMLKLDYVVNDPTKEKASPKLTLSSAVTLGMLLASEQPFMVTNPEMAKRTIEQERKEGLLKSYTQAAMMLDQIYTH